MNWWIIKSDFSFMFWLRVLIWCSKCRHANGGCDDVVSLDVFPSLSPPILKEDVATLTYKTYWTNEWLKDLSQWNWCTLLGTNISFSQGMFEDDFPFPKVGYVTFLEGIYFNPIYFPVLSQWVPPFLMDSNLQAQNRDRGEPTMDFRGWKRWIKLGGSICGVSGVRIIRVNGKKQTKTIGWIPKMTP